MVSREHHGPWAVIVLYPITSSIPMSRWRHMQRGFWQRREAGAMQIPAWLNIGETYRC